MTAREKEVAAEQRRACEEALRIEAEAGDHPICFGEPTRREDECEKCKTYRCRACGECDCGVFTKWATKMQIEDDPNAFINRAENVNGNMNNEVDLAETEIDIQDTQDYALETTQHDTNPTQDAEKLKILLSQARIPTGTGAATRQHLDLRVRQRTTK